MKIGLTLPSFVRDIDVPLAVATKADRDGVSGVFAYDHLFRTGSDGARRPSIECFALMTAVARETKSVNVGSLVIRASLRPVAVVASSLATVAAIAGSGRLIAGIGAGDTESRAEHDAFGIAFPALDDRVATLRSAAIAASDAVAGMQVWVAGTHHKVRAVAGEIGALNVWGVDVQRFASFARDLHAANADAVATWGGLVVLGDDDQHAHDRAAQMGAPRSATVGGAHTVARQLAAYRDAGAQWCVLAPIDASNLSNASWCAAVQDELR